MTFDPTTGAFALRYRSDPRITEPTVIVVPVSTHYPHGYCLGSRGRRDLPTRCAADRSPERLVGRLTSASRSPPAAAELATGRAPADGGVVRRPSRVSRAAPSGVCPAWRIGESRAQPVPECALMALW